MSDFNLIKLGQQSRKAAPRGASPAAQRFQSPALFKGTIAVAWDFTAYHSRSTLKEGPENRRHFSRPPGPHSLGDKRQSV